MLALCLGAAGLPSSVQAQERIARNFSMADGLSNPQVFAIAEDRAGFLWIGTWDGVSRFDGVTFTSFYARDGVPLGRIHAIHQAADGTLYLGGEGGAAFFNGERFLPLSPAGAGLEAIAGGPDGTAFFGGKTGLAARRPGGGWSTLSRISIKALCAARDGTLYMATGDRGVLVLRAGKISPLPVLDRHDVLALAEADDGTLYAGTRQGLIVLRKGSAEVVPSTRGHQIESITLSGDGTLYLATWASGVLRLRAAGLEPLEPLGPDSGISDERVHAVHAVRGGTVYFGTDDGLDRWSGDALEIWTRAQGLPDKTVWSVVEDGDHEIYVATDAGVAVLRGTRWRSLGPREGFPAGTAFCLHAGGSGLLYAGDDRGRVWISDQGRLLRIVTLPVRDWVTAVFESPDGVVYAATRGGFAAIRGMDIQFFPITGMVYSFALAPEETLYLGTSHGLAAFRDGKVFRVWTKKDGLVDDWIWTVRMAPDGSVLAGTRRGLAVLRHGRIENYDTGNGLANDFVVCILDDGKDRLYLSTNRGINVLDLHAPAQPRVFPLSGLRTGNPEACLRDSRGRLWFGIQPALVMYDPAKDHPRQSPRALLTGLRVFQDRFPPAVENPFPHDRNDLTFSFTGIDLAAHFLRFRYRLAGLDKSWIETDQRAVRYPNLRPGDYRFELQAVNDAGLWSPATGLPFTVLPPPWWRRPSLMLGLATAAVALAAGLYAAARVRQLLELERLRTAIAADLHDQVGAGLTDIAILSEVAARKAGGLPELARVAATARELVDSLGDIVWLVNPRQDTLYELFLRLKDSYAELFAHAGAELDVGDLSPFETVHLPMAYRQDLHLLFKEALHNALRHSGCRRAGLTVTFSGRQLAITLRDDGSGFDPANANGEGLETMRRRAERLGGRLTIDSSPEGTVVRFTGSVPNSLKPSLTSSES